MPAPIPILMITGDQGEIEIGPVETRPDTPVAEKRLASQVLTLPTPLTIYYS
jgi:hypothetical protein